ncbi:cystathionine beta-synthase [Aureobasidium subglaciale]|nr:cystathionine beta-synthase [Aureobasidium subglaciale]KAI5273240.1 cystathionine beta-synthase [Aureobasidium subglaciale]
MAETQSYKELLAKWADKYRGAIVEDLDPPAALSTSPSSPISSALMAAYEREYTHLTVVAPETRALVGYLSMPHLKHLLSAGTVRDTDTVDKAMTKFKRKGTKYHVITMDTPLEELEAFYEGITEDGQMPTQDFAVVTDAGRKFVLGVATKQDLQEFVKRRPVY